MGAHYNAKKRKSPPFVLKNWLISGKEKREAKVKVF